MSNLTIQVKNSRNWKPETWERKRVAAHNMLEQIKTKLPYDWCAWWTETDPITYVSQRIYRDFQSKDEVKAFAETNHYQPTNWSHIRCLSWHHRHGEYK